MMTVSSPGETPVLAEDSRQYLVFSLGNEEYGITIEHVQEIKGLAPITLLPNAPDYVKGVINLRGTIIPVIDLRLRLGMSEREHDRFTVIVVIALKDKHIGLVVDSVSDVLDIDTTQIDDSPPLTTDLDTTWFTGVGKPANRLVFFLDVERLTGFDDLGVDELD